MAAAEAAAAIDKKTSARILEIFVVIDLSGPHRLLAPIMRWYAASAGRATRRHHPADTCARRQFLTVVRLDIGIAPSAGGAKSVAVVEPTPRERVLVAWLSSLAQKRKRDRIIQS